MTSNFLPSILSFITRIGIHSGPIVAGVIGKKKFAFELFGDTVNTANRMQSHGAPGKIQVTRETYATLKSDFDCEPRGVIEVKGKGEMEPWFVVGGRRAFSAINAICPARSNAGWRARHRPRR